MRKAVCAVIIKDGCLLLVKKGNFWILPGGKPEGEETDIECLKREFKQELPDFRPTAGEHLGTFYGPTPRHPKELLRAEVYFAGGEGKITPAAEIKQAKWEKNPEKRRLSNITQKIVLALREERLFY